MEVWCVRITQIFTIRLGIALHEALVLAEDLAAASSGMRLVEEDVRLVIGDEENPQQAEERWLSPLFLLSRAHANFVRMII